MNELDRFVDSLVERLDAGVELREEPKVELKGAWPSIAEATTVWEVADLVAALANDPHLDGFRAVVYGPASGLARPAWLVDESVLRPKLLRHFEGGIVPRIELIRRQLITGEDVDFLVVVDQTEVPYVTRLGTGGEWVVRVRSGTSRRTATRAELVALVGGRRRAVPVRMLEARVDKPRDDMRRLTVTNVGTIACDTVTATIPDDAEASWEGSRERTVVIADRLEPTDRDAKYLFAGFDSMGGTGGSFSILVAAVAEDGERVVTSVRVSPNL